jgi:hypothetical protein
MPDIVAMTLISARAAGFISSDVFANKTAVPDTVATASESKNHAARKSSTSLSLRARMMDRPRDFQEYVAYARTVRALLIRCERCSGGPGRGRNQSAAGIVKIIHQRPMMKRTSRSEKRVESVTVITQMADSCTKSAAIYPIPIPYDDILVAMDSCVAELYDVTTSWGGFGLSSDVDASNEWRAGSSSGVLDSPVPLEYSSSSSALSRTCVSGWFLTRRGRNEFNNTELAPKQVFDTMASKAPSNNTFGVMDRKSMVARAPEHAKMSRNDFR